MKLEIVCKDCFPKQYGDIPEWVFEESYELTKEKGTCGLCKKKKHLVLRKSPNKDSYFIIK